LTFVVVEADEGLRADGCFPLPNGPGLGITLNEAFVTEHPPRDAFFDLFAENWHRRESGTQTTTGTDDGDLEPSQGMEVQHD
jgi:galactonate dehydratase